MEKEPKPLPEGWMRTSKGRTVRIPVLTKKRPKSKPLTPSSPKPNKQKSYKINYISTDDFEMTVYGKKTVKKEPVESVGERLIKEFLDKQNISYTEQATFDECVNPATNRKLRFDFYLPAYNTCIEFDGKQHFKASYDFHGSNARSELKKQKERDFIKTEFCKNAHIRLVRLNYKHYKKIEKMLRKLLKLK
jgi:hypothetical protein